MTDPLDGALEELLSAEYALAPDEAADRIGQVLSGRYRLDAILSKGGLGTVYRGEHVHMRKQMAVKILHPETKQHPHLVTRFEREAIAGAHIHHHNVAVATDFGQLDDGTYFLVMEYVNGRPLHEILHGGRLPALRAARIARQIAAGLGAAHGVGIAHRDLKPANVMVDEAEGDLVKLIDFGFARIDFNRLSLPDTRRKSKPPPPRLTRGNVVFGTPAYMAPEAVGGMDAVDYRSDLYALGVILFEMLAGERPFDDPNAVRLLRAKHQQAAPSLTRFLGPDAVPARLETLVARLLERDPADRYPSAQRVFDALGDTIDTLAPSSWSEVMGAGQASDIAHGPTQELHLPAPEGADPAGAPSLDSEVLADPGGLAVSPTPRPMNADAPVSEGDSGATEPAGPGASPSPARPQPSRLGWAVVSVAVAASVVAGLLWTRTHRLGGSPPGESVVTAPSALPAIVESSSAAPIAPPSSETAAAAASSSPPTGEHAIRAQTSSELRAEMWRAYARKEWQTGAEMLIALIEEDPAALSEPDVVSAAAAIALAVDNVNAPVAARLMSALGTAGGSGGVDVLYQIAMAGPTRRCGKQALETLQKAEVLARATPAARVAVALRLAGCAQKRELFGLAARDGDDRALGELQALYAMKCGRKKPGPCCFKRDTALAEALTVLSSRVGKR